LTFLQDLAPKYFQLVVKKIENYLQLFKIATVPIEEDVLKFVLATSNINWLQTRCNSESFISFE